eukprot:TRINITY_DN4727_c0_g1_i1.p1 TRINITY_DN4727_c0_g1~~TRINITY_DN4727_c0_g1_i1.p1  ORF type:complete len:936 (+),score=239.74 TRINITY_DN4727_c0_g1_i1:48-2810(+)
MGELLRSQEMELVQLILQVEAAHDTVDELGKLGCLQFNDLNHHVNAFQRNFVNEIKRMDELHRIIKLLEKAYRDLQESITEKKERTKLVSVDVSTFDDKTHLDELETKLEDLEKQLKQLNEHAAKLEKVHVQLIEYRFILESDELSFDNNSALPADEEDEEHVGLDDDKGKNGKNGKSSKTPLKDDEEIEDIEVAGKKGIKFGTVCGVINRSSFETMKRLLWRQARGNLIMKSVEIPQLIKDASQEGLPLVEKNAFLVFCPGHVLEDKVKKLCIAFGANMYSLPGNKSAANKVVAKITTEISDTEQLLSASWDQRRVIYKEISQNLNSWKAFVKKEKAIYHSMNMFSYDPGHKCLLAEGWCPKSKIDEVQLALRRGRVRSGALVPTILNVINPKEHQTPPTYFQTNTLSKPYQAIVNSYGIPRYREINPAVFTIITFPFEFGIMFGDVGHGILFMIISFLLISKEKDWKGKKLNEMIELPFKGRYVMLMMSFFSIYMGALYNEMFSLSMDFGSNWMIVVDEKTNEAGYQRINPNWTYAFGVDPVWKGATNELIYYNSLKMKMSIIFGVCQMSLGLFLHFLNGIYFKKYEDIFFEFLPRVTFLWSIFGYLCFMIIYKWNVDYPGQDAFNAAHNITGEAARGAQAGTSAAPVILNELIFMFLQGPKDNPLYPGQYVVQNVLLALAFISIPLMMCVKPFILKAQYKKQHPHVKQRAEDVTIHLENINLDQEDSSSSVQVEEDDDDDNKKKKASKKAPKNGSGKNDNHELKATPPVKSEGQGGHGGHGHGEEFEFGEIFVHQILETIEFILGSVSHTASYLRLWALSLAHSELATVFWDKIFYQLASFGMTSHWALTGLLVFFGFSGWFGATVLIILFMESLSAFLHALRLHWVEFQSKFYKGDGLLFTPLSYRRLIKSIDLDD